MPITLPGLSICPRIRRKEGRLVASTPWSIRLLTLGTFFREVVVDPERQEVRIRRRYLWLFSRRQRIPFRSIRAIAYGYEDLAPGRGWTWTHESTDLFRVGLRVDDWEKVHLFSFFGKGTFSNDGPLPDWVYLPGHALDPSGTQEGASRAFVEVLGKMIGAPVEPG